QILPRARFAVAVECTADVSQPQARRDGDGVERDAIAVSHFRAYEPAAIARSGALKPIRRSVVRDLARALVVDAAAIERKVEIFRRPVETAVSAAEHVSGVDRLHVEFDRLAA